MHTLMLIYSSFIRIIKRVYLCRNNKKKEKIPSGNKAGGRPTSGSSHNKLLGLPGASHSKLQFLALSISS